MNFENNKLMPIDILIERAKKITSAEQSLKKFSQPKKERKKFDSLVE